MRNFQDVDQEIFDYEFDDLENNHSDEDDWGSKKKKKKGGHGSLAKIRKIGTTGASNGSLIYSNPVALSSSAPTPHDFRPFACQRS